LICSEVKASIIAIRDGEKRKMGQGLKFIILTRKRALIGILGLHLFMEKGHLLFFTSTLQIFMAESSVNNKLINCSDDVCVTGHKNWTQDTGHWTQDPAGKSIFKMNYVCSYAVRIYICRYN